MTEKARQILEAYARLGSAPKAAIACNCARGYADRVIRRHRKPKKTVDLSREVNLAERQDEAAIRQVYLEMTAYPVGIMGFRIG